MKNVILILFLFVLPFTSDAQWFWGSQDGKDTAVNLTKRIGNNEDAKTIEFGASDPTITATEASQGSIFVTSDSVFQKRDNGSSTNWDKLVESVNSLSPDSAMITDGSGNASSSVVTSTEVGHLSGVTSAIQTQIDSKEPTITATTSADYYRGDKTFQVLDSLAVPENTNLYYTDARAIAAPITGFVSGAGVVSASDSVLQSVNKLDGNIATKITTGVGAIVNADISATANIDATKIGSGAQTISNAEYEYLDGLTSPIQTQLDSKVGIGTGFATGKIIQALSGSGLESSYLNLPLADGTGSGSGGQFLQTNGSGSGKWTNILGTTNQVITTYSAPNLTLSLPQNIATFSSPIFTDGNYSRNILFSGSGNGIGRVLKSLNVTLAAADSIALTGGSSTVNTRTWKQGSGSANGATIYVAGTGTGADFFSHHHLVLP